MNGMTIEIALLKERVKGRVQFVYFRDGTLWYTCDDGWEFPVAVEDTTNAQGACPTFKAEDKGIVFMRWIRKQMEVEASYQAEASSSR